METSIVVNQKNSEKLNAAIRAVEGTARVRTLDAKDVLHAVQLAEQRLSGLPKRLWAGAQAVYNPHSVARSYDYTPAATIITINRTTSSWRLVEVTRGYAHRGQLPSHGGLRLQLPHSIDTRDLLNAMLAKAAIELAPTPWPAQGMTTTSPRTEEMVGDMAP